VSERIPALIEPRLLNWARTCLNMSLEQAASRISVKPERLESWEEGTSQPSIPQIRNVANAYKMPLATFYMEKPPRGYTIMRDFRRVAESGIVPFSTELILEIQNAHYLREKALELYELLDRNAPIPPARIEMTQEIESTATCIRSMLGISRHAQVNLPGNYEAFRFWKNALEKKGLLVLQSLGVSVDEMRGFSVGLMPLPCVVVNVHDSVLARVFTVIHELVHVLLHADGICDLFDDSEDQDKKSIERFCNYVAGAVLVPAEYLLLENQIRYYEIGEEWSDEDIEDLADKYKVSREVLVRRLLICGRVTQDFYQQKREQYMRTPHRDKGGGWPSPATDAIRGLGEPYIRLIYSAYSNGLITMSDMSDFLGVRTKHFDRIEREVFKRWDIASTRAG
jgi:Zn-dependent peptidase ImmA (M78 family)/transcriptional regulator with XRE-family HTH domain